MHRGADAAGLWSRIILLPLLTVSVLFGGCTSRLYSGPRLPSSEVAVVAGSSHYWIVQATGVNIKAVDGVATHNKVELLPGPHIIDVSFHAEELGMRYSSRGRCSIQFDASAGHTYCVDGEFTHRQQKWHAWMVDEGTGARYECLFDGKPAEPEGPDTDDE